MKIKTTKKMNLPELLQHLMDNEELRGLFYSPTPLRGGVRVSKSGEVLVENVWADDTFTVEVEEIVTPATRFDELTEYIYDSNDDHHFTAEHKGANISLIIDCETHQFKTQAIYCKDTLIWTKEHGIPESGIVEVNNDENL